MRPSGNLQINHSHLALTNQASLTLSAQSIIIDQAQLNTINGSIRLYGQGDNTGIFAFNNNLPKGNGEITIQGGNITLTGNHNSNLMLSGATVNIKNQAAIFHSNNTADDSFGKIIIDAAQLIINNAQIATAVYGEGKGADLIINTNNDLQILSQNFRLATNTYGKGNAGNININTGRIMIDGYASKLGLGTGPGIASDSFAQGNAGNIMLNIIDDAIILNGGGISSNARGTGNAGNIKLNANQLIIDGKAVNL